MLSSVASWNLAGRLPENVVDLYAEHRNETNGEKTPCGDGLLGALALRGLAHIDAGEKDEMRRLILDQQDWSDDEKRRILDYCASDVTGTRALFSKMAPSIDWPRALLRGRYMKAVAQNGAKRRSNRYGPASATDCQLGEPQSPTSLLRWMLDFGVYEGTTFKADGLPICCRPAELHGRSIRAAH